MQDKFLNTNYSLRLNISLIKLGLVLLTLGTIIPIISIWYYLEIPYERSVSKGIGVILIIAGSFFVLRDKKFQISKSDFVFSSLFLSIPIIFAISATIYDLSSSLNQWLRLISCAFLILSFAILDKNELKYILKIYLYVSFCLAFIAFLQFIFGYPRMEKFPLLEIYSNRSIVFEQNVFGIYMYLSLMICIFLKSLFKSKLPKLLVLSFLFGLLISFYRTVYALALIRLIISHPFKSICVLLVILYMTGIAEFIFEALKLDQIQDLTGRNVLWSIGLESFMSSPIIGNGENSIPIISNEVFNRAVPYTTYHNVFVDVLAIGGVIGFIFYFFGIMIAFFMIHKSHRVLFLFLLAPSLSNTFFLFMPNVIGGIIGAFIFYSIRLRHDQSFE